MRWSYTARQAWARFLCTAGSCLLIFAAAAAGAAFSREVEDSVNPTAEVPVSSAPEGSAKYIVRAYQERLAVFRPDAETPEMLFDVYIATLPDYDQALLEQGIPAENYQVLMRLIEDYIS